jgi:hypothetical protein
MTISRWFAPWDYRIIINDKKKTKTNNFASDDIFFNELY